MTDQQSIQSTENSPIINMANNNNKFKILFIISTILLVIILGVSILLLLQNKKLSNNSQTITVQTPTQFQSSISPTNIISPSISPNISLDQTSDWRTYTNRTYGYEIKYPSNWFIYVDKNGFGRDELHIEAKQRDVRSHIVDSDSLSVNIAKLNETKGTFFETGMNGTKELITISGVVGKRSDDGNGQSIFLQKDDFVYALQSYYQINMSNSPVDPQNKQILDKMINSFKFIPIISVNSNIPSDWKTYTDKILGFSISYPAGLDAPTQMPKGYSKPYITFDAQKISELNYPLGRDSETAAKSKEALKNGEFGPVIGFSNENSRKVVKLSDSINAKNFMILGQFDVCDIQLSRNLIFYINDYQVEISYIYPIFSENSSKIIPIQYLKNDQENCGQLKIWRSQDDFYRAISTNSLENQTLQNWYNDFDQIISTFQSTH